MKIKGFITLAFAFISIFCAEAQTVCDSVGLGGKIFYDALSETSSPQVTRRLHWTIAIGRSVNTGGNENEYWFGRQRDTRGEFATRFSYIFGSHWGIYGDLFFGSVHDWEPPIEGEWYYGDDCGNVMTASCGAGVTYLFGRNKWQFFPRAGIGICSIDGTCERLRYLYDAEDSEFNPLMAEEVISATRITEPAYVNLGISASFRLTRGLSLIADLNYRYPISTSTVEIVRRTNPQDEETTP